MLQARQRGGGQPTNCCVLSRLHRATLHTAPPARRSPSVRQRVVLGHEVSQLEAVGLDELARVLVDVDAVEQHARQVVPRERLSRADVREGLDLAMEVVA